MLKIENGKCIDRIGVFLSMLVLFIWFFDDAVFAKGYGPVVANVTGEGFTVSWISDVPRIGSVKIYQNNKLIGNYGDDRGKNYNYYTHHVTINKLNPMTAYSFSIANGNAVGGNKGKYYDARTGPPLIRVGSVQPAGRVFLKDGRTIAEGALVYITLGVDGKRSALLSTRVDRNGYWFLEIINARTEDNKNLFRISLAKGDIAVQVVSQEGTAMFKGRIMDNKGGKNLYSSMTLK